MDRIVHPVGKAEDVKFIARCYIFEPPDGTMKPLAHITKHFIRAICTECGNETEGNIDRGKDAGTARKERSHCTGECISDNILTKHLLVPRVQGAVVDDLSRRKETTAFTLQLRPVYILNDA